MRPPYRLRPRDGLREMKVLQLPADHESASEPEHAWVTATRARSLECELDNRSASRRDLSNFQRHRRRPYLGPTRNCRTRHDDIRHIHGGGVLEGERHEQPAVIHRNARHGGFETRLGNLRLTGTHGRHRRERARRQRASFHRSVRASVVRVEICASVRVTPRCALSSLMYALSRTSRVRGLPRCSAEDAWCNLAASELPTPRP